MTIPVPAGPHVVADAFDPYEALAGLDVGVACTGSDGRVCYVNPAWQAIVGPDVEALVAGVEADDGGSRRVRPPHAGAGALLDVRARATPSGGLLLTARSVTAEDRREQVPGRVLESIGEGLFVVTRAWELTYLNAAAERIGAVPRSGALGRSLWEVYPALVGTELEAMCRAAMADRTPHAARTAAVRRRAEGRAALFDAQCYPIEGDGAVVLFSEVSARERQARALAERSAENERLRELARAMAAESDARALLDMLCAVAVELCGAAGATVAEVVDGAHGRFVATTNHPSEVHGHSFALAGTLTGRLLDEVTAGARVPVLRARAREAEDAAYCPLFADGRRVGHLLLAALAAHGQALGVLAVSRAAGDPAFTGRDEERLRVVADHAALALWKARLVDEARAANELKSGFLATVSHELRTPLTALTGYGELVADEILGPLTPAQADVMERMRAVTHQLTGMIEEILTFSALEAGRELVRPGPVDAAEVVRAVTAVVEPLAGPKGLAFHAEVPADAPFLVTDSDKLRQILVNLCGNAVKFTERGGVWLAVAARAGRVEFVVRDTGVGIADADLPRLFHAFTQLDTGLTRRYGGTGLGLYISRRLAQLLGGRIDVRSAPGAGSTFTLVLPAEPA